MTPSKPSCAYFSVAAMVMLDVGPMSYVMKSEALARRFFTVAQIAVRHIEYAVQLDAHAQELLFDAQIA